MNNPKILVLILAIDKDPWKKIEIEGQLLTWRAHPPENIEIFRYTGDSNFHASWNILNAIWKVNYKITNFFSSKVPLISVNKLASNLKAAPWAVSKENKEIHTGIPELYSLIGHKTLQAFKACMAEFDFDYIYRTNVSSYLKLEGLNSYIKDQPRINFFSGYKGTHHGITFASGSGYFISKDLVERVVSLEDHWDHDLIDDVAIGKLLGIHHDVQIREAERLDFDSIESYAEDQINDNQQIFHFRCKAKNADVTISLMHMLHSQKNLSG